MIKPSDFYFPQRVAIFVDGAFYLKRIANICKIDIFHLSPKQIAEEFHRKVCRHLIQNGNRDVLYRIFYYDAPPSDKKIHHILNHKAIDLSKSRLYAFKMELFRELKHKRKVALRLGEIHETKPIAWKIKMEPLKNLLRTANLADLKEEDFQPDFSQKGVDMRLGLDIAAVAFKKHVDKIVLVTGDSDFVPAAKLARREGLDVILDPMGAPIKDMLSDHVDGVRSVFFPSTPQGESDCENV
jgi:uncharacterized LabA/DUF88 family protein